MKKGLCPIKHTSIGFWIIFEPLSLFLFLCTANGLPSITNICIIFAPFFASMDILCICYFFRSFILRIDYFTSLVLVNRYLILVRPLEPTPIHNYQPIPIHSV